MYCGVFPGGSDGKESACSVGDPGSIPGSERSPGGGHGSLLQYSCLEYSVDRGDWQATYSPWGHKELDTTEQLSLTHSKCTMLDRMLSNGKWIYPGFTMCKTSVWGFRGRDCPMLSSPRQGRLWFPPEGMRLCGGHHEVQRWQGPYMRRDMWCRPPG